MFRAKHFEGIQELQIPRNNVNLIQRSKCVTSEAISDDDSFIFSSNKDKRNIMGAYFESINSPKYLNSGTRIKLLTVQLLK